MFSKNNKIAVVLLWTGFSVIAAGIIAGIIIGDDICVLGLRVSIGIILHRFIGNYRAAAQIKYETQ